LFLTTEVLQNQTFCLVLSVTLEMQMDRASLKDALRSCQGEPVTVCSRSALNCIKSTKFSSSSVEHLTTCKMILQPERNQLRVQGQYNSEGRC